MSRYTCLELEPNSNTVTGVVTELEINREYKVGDYIWVKRINTVEHLKVIRVDGRYYNGKVVA